MAPKYRQLADVLREMIELSTESVLKLPTERELAGMYQVSRQTVRQALGILASEGLIDKRQGSGNYASPQNERIKQIAIITPSEEYIFSSVLREMEAAFVADGCSVQVYSTENRVGREREILENILKDPPDGICIKGTMSALPNPNLDHYRRLKNQGVSVLFLDGCYPGLEEMVSVSPDNLAGGYLAVRYLIQQDHTRIGSLFRNDDLQGLERFGGCINAIRDYGLSLIDDCYFWYDRRGSDLMRKKGESSRLQAIAGRLREQCSAVICQNEETAYWLLRALHAAGDTDEKGFSVLCFDDGYYGGIGRMPVSALSCRGSHPGRVAAEAVLDMISKKKRDSVRVNWEFERKNS